MSKYNNKRYSSTDANRKTINTGTNNVDNPYEVQLSLHKKGKLYMPISDLLYGHGTTRADLEDRMFINLYPTAEILEYIGNKFSLGFSMYGNSISMFGRSSVDKGVFYPKYRTIFFLNCFSEEWDIDKMTVMYNKDKCEKTIEDLKTIAPFPTKVVMIYSDIKKIEVFENCLIHNIEECEISFILENKNISSFQSVFSHWSGTGKTSSKTIYHEKPLKRKESTIYV